MIEAHGSDPQPTPPVLRIWNVEDGQLLIELTEQLGAATVAFHHDSLRVAIGLADGHVRLYALPDGTPCGELALSRSIVHLAFSPRDHRLAVACDGETRLHLVEVETWEQETVPLPSLPSSLAWGAGHNELATGMMDGSIHVFRPRPDRTARRRLIGHTQRVVGLQFLWQGRVLASRAWDGTTRIWNVESGETALRIDGAELIEQEHGHEGLLGFTRGTVEFGVWSVAGGMPLRFLGQGDAANRRWSVRFHPQDPHLLAAATSRGVELWDVPRQHLIQVLGTREVRSAEFRDEGRELVTSGVDGIQAWDVDVGPEGDQDDQPLAVRAEGPRTLVPGVFQDLEPDRSGRICLATLRGRAAVLIDLDVPESPGWNP